MKHKTFEDWFDARELARMHVEDEVNWVIDRQESKRLMTWLRAAFEAGRESDATDLVCGASPSPQYEHVYHQTAGYCLYCGERPAVEVVHEPNDVVRINGIKYAGDMFRELGLQSRVGDSFQIESSGTVWLRWLEPGSIVPPRELNRG